MNLAFQAICGKKQLLKSYKDIMLDHEGVPLIENGAEFKIEVSILKDQATDFD